MIGEAICLANLFYDLCYFSDISSRNLRKQVMLNLFIESSKEFGRETIAGDIAGRTSLEINPCIFSYMETIDNLESNMIYHEDIPENHSHNNSNSEKYQNTYEDSKMIDKECWEKEKQEIHE